ncbi:hypothetical protein TNCV_1155871 [Trichonephila clavipes]|nr:hypothetical protein TNCV_1155871 [Trichonephila clavipes]
MIVNLKEIFSVRTIITRRRGRPRFRWIEAVEDNCLVLKAKIWRNLAARVQVLRNVWLRRPLPILGCRALDDDDDDVIILTLCEVSKP